MANRRNFIKKSVAGSLGIGALGLSACSAEKTIPSGEMPIVLSTWDFGKFANAEAWRILEAGGWALDAVEAGVKITEADANNTTVGIGGAPDRDGYVTLDACLMDDRGRCGAVAFLENIAHPIAVARKVMEETPHIMLVGEGALKFAKQMGFEEINLLTEKSKLAYEKWLERAEYAPQINVENHDTIGMLALDAEGRLAGACTTSGAAYKMRGRVGDSPIIGAGLFVEPGIGAATATGLGEEVIRNAGSALVVELMRQGRSPQEACMEMVERVVKKNPNAPGLQVGFIALNAFGAIGAYAIQPGFTYAVHSASGVVVQEAEAHFGKA
jgi:isoaspartyl peptidase/L-asparaginase-like protein (Ntn-hydrolase superfamily)